MKIGTDGILLGSWVDCSDKKNGLDIGTGTGVIAIMMCQKNTKLKMHGIEISKNACLDADYNFKISNWKNNLELFKCSLEEHSRDFQYDIICSNPPFFKTTFTSKDKETSLAKHQESLSYIKVIEFANKQLTKKGSVNLIIPFDTAEDCKRIALNNDLHLTKECIIYPKKNIKASRSLLEFSKEKSILKKEELIIENDNRHDYTTDYKKLTRDFYTIFS